MALVAFGISARTASGERGGIVTGRPSHREWGKCCRARRMISESGTIDSRLQPGPIRPPGGYERARKHCGGQRAILRAVA